MNEREWIEKLQRARVELYLALKARETAEREQLRTKLAADQALCECNEVREAFDEWLLQRAGVEARVEPA